MIGVLQRYLEIFHHSSKYQGILNLGIYRVFNSSVAGERVVFTRGRYVAHFFL